MNTKKVYIHAGLYAYKERYNWVFFGKQNMNGLTRSLTTFRRCLLPGFGAHGSVFAASTPGCFGKLKLQEFAWLSSTSRRCSLQDSKKHSFKYDASVRFGSVLLKMFSQSNIENEDNEGELYTDSSEKSRFIGAESHMKSSYYEDEVMEGGASLPNKKEKGDYCDIIEILSTTKTNFLIRSNGDLVKTEYLKGKLIAVFFEDIRTSCFLTFSHPRAILKMDLIDAYLEPSQKGDFEVVFVALADDNLSVEDGVKFFDDVFTGKPWLAVPFLDFKSRHHLVNLLYKPAFDNYGCVILDSNGKILQQSTDIAHYFPYYGMDWYPFTDERCIELCEEYQLRGTDLKTLLVSPSRDFVISNKGEKVPISELEGKVVGLYLLGFQHSHLIMKKLVKAYEELKGKGENFEIVLVNCHTDGGYMDKKSFEENFRKMPWLALPFKDNLCRRLARNFSFGYSSLNNSLLIIGPGGTFLENISATILELYGSEAYPFTRKKAVEIEFNRAKAITMESVIKAAGLDYIFQISGDRFVKIPVSHLQGKRIILYFAEDGTCAWELDEVTDWYNAIKGKDDSFEVIYVSGNCDEITFGKLLPMMPWLAFPFEAAGGVNRLVWNTSQYLASPSLVAFGLDGRLITRHAERYCFGCRGLVEFHALVQWAEAYPSKDHLLKEMVAEVNRKILGGV